MHNSTELASHRFHTEGFNKLQFAVTKTAIDLTLLPISVSKKLFEKIETSQLRRTVGPKLNHTLDQLSITKQISQQLDFGDLSVGIENHNSELVGSLLGGSLLIGSLLEFAKITYGAISHDHTILQKMAHGYMGVLLAESSITLASFGALVGRELAAPIANHQTRQGIEHFLEIEHVGSENTI